MPIELRLDRCAVGLLQRPLANRVDEITEMGEPITDATEARVVRQIRPAHCRNQSNERTPFGRVPADHHHLAVGCRENGVVARSERTDPIGRDLPVPQVVVDMLVDVEHRLGHRNFHLLAAPGALAVIQRGEDRTGRFQ